MPLSENLVPFVCRIADLRACWEKRADVVWCVQCSVPGEDFCFSTLFFPFGPACKPHTRAFTTRSRASASNTWTPSLNRTCPPKPKVRELLLVHVCMSCVFCVYLISFLSEISLWFFSSSSEGVLNVDKRSSRWTKVGPYVKSYLTNVLLVGPMLVNHSFFASYFLSVVGFLFLFADGCVLCVLCFPSGGRASGASAHCPLGARASPLRSLCATAAETRQGSGYHNLDSDSGHGSVPRPEPSLPSFPFLSFFSPVHLCLNIHASGF